jgi:hypothetical protein
MAMHRAAAWSLALTFVAIAPSASRGAGGDAAAAPIEPTWKTVVLAPGRVVANGRFDAARPGYHVERAEKKAAAEAARAAAACSCDCAKR